MSKHKISLFIFFSLFVIICGCNESVNPPIIENYSISVWDYSDNSFLADTLYKSCFEAYYKDTTGILPQFVIGNKILSGNPDFEIWVQAEPTAQNIRIASGYVQLSQKPAEGYPDSLKRAVPIPGISAMGYFRKLSPSEYYISDFAGMICLKINLPEVYNAGIIYSTFDGKQYGSNSNPLDTIILKLFKVNNQSPIYTLAWQLKLKNVYKLPVRNIDAGSFTFNIKYKTSPTTFITKPGITKTFLKIFHLTNRNDDNFKFEPYKTIIPETGEIIFPSLRPFYDDLINAGVDTVYYFSEIYNNSKTEAQFTPNAGLYIINGFAKSSY